MIVLLKEPTGAYNGVQTQALQASTNYESDALTTMPHHYSKMAAQVSVSVAPHFFLGLNWAHTWVNMSKLINVSWY